MCGLKDRVAAAAAAAAASSSPAANAPEDSSCANNPLALVIDDGLHSNSPNLGHSESATTQASLSASASNVKPITTHDASSSNQASVLAPKPTTGVVNEGGSSTSDPTSGPEITRGARSASIRSAELASDVESSGAEEKPPAKSRTPAVVSKGLRVVRSAVELARRWPMHMLLAFLFLAASGVSAGLAWRAWSSAEKQGMKSEAERETNLAMLAISESLQSFVSRVRLMSALMATRDWTNIDYVEIQNMIRTILNDNAEVSGLRCGVTQVIHPENRTAFEHHVSFKLGRFRPVYDIRTRNTSTYDNTVKEALYFSSCLTEEVLSVNCGRPTDFYSSATVKKEIMRAILRGEPSISIPRSSPIGYEVISVYSSAVQDARQFRLDQPLTIPINENPLPATAAERLQQHKASVYCVFSPQSFFELTNARLIDSDSINIKVEMTRDDSDIKRTAFLSPDLKDADEDLSAHELPSWAYQKSTTIYGTKIIVQGFLTESAKQKQLYSWKTPVVIMIACLPFVFASLVIASLIQSKQREHLIEHVANSKRQALRRFLNCTSHDLRTPLQAITSILGLLKSEIVHNRLPDDADELVKLGSGSAQMMNLILSNVLDFDKIENSKTGELVMDHQPCNLEKEIQNLTEVIRFSSLNKSDSVEVSFQSSPTKLPIVKCDFTRILRVALNLLSNSIKFTEKGYVKISIQQLSRCPEWLVRRQNRESTRARKLSLLPEDESSGTPDSVGLSGLPSTAGSDSVELFPSDALEVTADDRIWVEIKVRDTGKGIPKERIGKVLKPYECSPHDQGGGSGLGLFICDNVARAYGGGVNVQSSVGRGTRVSVVFNMEVVHQPMPEAQMENAHADSSPTNMDPKSTLSTVAEEVASSSGKTPSSVGQTPSSTSRMEPVKSKGCNFPAVQGKEASSSVAQHDNRVVVAFIEDNNTIRRLGERTLKSFPEVREVAIAKDGVEGLALLKSRADIDVVFSDINMPNMNGDECIQQYRAWEAASGTRRKVAVAVTGNASAEHATEYINCGFDEMISKPITSEKLKKLTEACRAAKSSSTHDQSHAAV